MKRFEKKRHLLFSIFTGAGLVLGLAVLPLLFYGWSISRDIDKRFSDRRWSIPSRVYSDSTLLFPGQKVLSSSLFKKLKDLGYREVEHRPNRKGEMRKRGKKSIEIFLRDLRLPSRKRDGFPVVIRMGGGEIHAIVDARNGKSIPLLELEPEELMLFFGPEREQRRLISISQVPDHVLKAFLAAEDRRFYRHHGLDLRGIIRALYTDLRKGKIAQGGSTITQQLAKNYFLTPERTLRRKLKEMLMALVIELMYDKDEILEIYLNEIYFGQKGSVAVNGLGEAALFYFGKPVEELSLEEGAAIAGLVRAPNLYSPYISRKRCKARRDTVLKQMFTQGWISREEYQRAVTSPVLPAGFNTYGKKAPYFMDYLSRQLKALYPPKVLSSLGLSIYTTLDTQVQRAAEKALSRGLARIEKRHPGLSRRAPGKRLQGAIIVMQPKTGYILALVGGRNYGVNQFNRATQAKRQPGSAFKPFVFLCGLDRFSPATRLSNLPATYQVKGRSWNPRNFSPVPEKRLSLREALARSVNLATVDLAMKVGLGNVARTARLFGFSTPMKPYPSLALGALEVIPIELARAYCPFAADGLLPFPLSLKEVVDEKGNVLERRHMTIQRVTSPAKAYIMSSLLRSVVTSGTARSLRKFGVTLPVAGKTGTTNDYRDAWFVGYTPDILALVWVGFDDGTSIRETGASAALPIWADLIKQIPQHLSGGWFQKPPGVVEAAVCPESGKLAVPGRCPHPIKEVFLEGLVPGENCPIHRSRNPLKKIIEKLHDLFENS
ncbi:MAG: PBP1A family penicillin-binding protein [Deltaproteobacteria bacterium]|nr:PBP1A family penicillin-binding protein [Deltaproteobacteria bacterium]